MSLWLVGLGPSPGLDDLTRRGEAALRRCQEVWLDMVTAGAGEQRAEALQALLGRPLRLAYHLDHAERALLSSQASQLEVALAVAGDPLVATPHRHLVRTLRAQGVEVQLVPGVSALTAVASQAGIDAAAAAVVVVGDPAAPSAEELAALASARARRQGVLVLAAGREPEPPAEAWQALAARWPQEAAPIALDGGGLALVLRPPATC